MKKRVIKVIKSDAEPVPPTAPTTKEIRIQVEKDRVEDDRDMASNVKNWITERRENSRVEENTAKNNRVAWHKKNR